MQSSIRHNLNHDLPNKSNPQATTHFSLVSYFSHIHCKLNFTHSRKFNSQILSINLSSCFDYLSSKPYSRLLGPPFNGVN